MSISAFALRSLRFHWRTNLAVALGVAVGCAVLAGALLVGTSVRGSLRDMALERLGRVDYALQSNRFFRESLAADIAARVSGSQACPAILSNASVTHAEHGTRAGKVNLIAAPLAFWELGDAPLNVAPHGRNIVINATLARDLHAAVSDDLLLRLPAYSVIPSESLMGRRDSGVRSLRSTVSAIIPDRGLGRFGLRPGQQATRNAYIPLARSQATLDQPERVNTILITTDDRRNQEALDAAIAAAVTMDDLGVRLVQRSIGGEQNAFEYLSIESSQMVLPRDVEQAAAAAIQELGLAASPVLTYLANIIRKQAGDTAGEAGQIVPYSIVAAVDLPFPALFPPFDFVAARPHLANRPLNDSEIILNQWAAERINATVGQTLELGFYMLEPGGELRTDTAAFTVAGIVRLLGAAADPGLTPAYPGIHEARSMSDWDPPFPIDYKLIHDADESYWREHRATPKAFISLRAGQKLWADEQQSAARFGRLTSIRIAPPDGEPLERIAAEFEAALRRNLRYEQSGLMLNPVKRDALQASTGATDFGVLFIAFSFFLIASAALLVVLLFRLAAEQRSREIGILLALGFGIRRVRRIQLLEGTLLAIAGGVLGAPAALGYAWLMLAGLRTLWRDAVGSSALTLHVAAADIAIGSLAGVILGILAIVWALRTIGRRPVTALLARAIPTDMDGVGTGAESGASSRLRRRRWFANAALGAALACVAGSFFVHGGGAQAGLFFGAGASLLIGLLARLSLWLQIGDSGPLRPGAAALARLGCRNAARRPDRTLLTVSLIACATFVVVGVGASRHTPHFDPADKHAGHGGFALFGESDVPILYDLNTDAGRRNLGLSADARRRFADARVFPMRRRAGDDASCLNLYKPQSPTILAAPRALIDRGGFAFAATLAESDREKANPWLLLDGDLPDGAIPAFGDYNTVMWLLHLGLGDDLIVRDDAGRDVKLRIVGTFSGSIFQSELVVGERRFLEHFPRNAGYQTFLVETPSAGVEAFRAATESALADYGFDLIRSTDRIAAFLAVENTYLSTFQMLGGLGLLLGTLGVATVLLRNIIERRGELALLAAVGFRRRSIAVIVLSEALALICTGVLIGALAAIVAVAPNAIINARNIPWGGLLITLAGIVLAGGLVSTAAWRAALRQDLIQALRAA